MSVRARRIWAGAGVAMVAALMLPSPARAHALLSGSEPAEGARLTSPPEEVVLRLTEAPELALSSMELLDTSGGEIPTDGPEAVPGQSTSLRLPLPELQKGVYTVTWRTVSRVDGHPSGGAFAFGIGVSPSEVAQVAVTTPETPDPSPLEMVGRLITFVGLGLVVGATWIGALAFPQPPRALRRLAGWAWVGGLVGIALLAVAQQRGSGAGFAEFLPTRPGRAILYRGGALALAGTGLLAARLWTASQRRALLLAGAAAAGAMLAHVTAGHAAARGDLAWAKVVAQWVHFLAAAVWLGGLAALLVGIRGKPDGAKTSAVRRFSLVAGVALGAVVLTGVIRSIQEIGSWSGLFTTGYGIAVLVKAGLILALAALGAINRYRNVPKAGSTLTGLRTISRGELSLAVAAVGAAAVLATLVPPASVPALAGPPPGLTATGADFATSVRVKLDVSPGSPGPNRFSFTATDYDSGDPVDADVKLRFRSLAVTGAESELELAPTDDGVYEGTGSNLAFGGPWAVSAVIQQAADSTEVLLELATVCPAIQIDSPKPNLPTVNVVDTPDGGSVEGYLIELGGSSYEVHFTFIAPGGKEVPVKGLPSMTAWRPGTPPLSLEPIPLTRGHFIANAELEAGDWRFDGTATSAGGSSSGCFEQQLAA
ncbi:MAG: copper resistance protein CopC [Actinomycetota bacterium]